MGFFCYFLLFFVVIPWAACQVKDFVSIDCGGTGNYTDTSTGLTWVSDASFIRDGEIAEVGSSNVSKSQYNYRRDFHADNQKYCYSLSTTQRKRYIVRATFLYGSTETGDTSPRFMLYLDSTLWASISIGDASRIYVEEMILKAPSTKVDVCVCCASTGSPFISTLELRPLNGSMYATDFEDAFYLAVAARINFGALTTDAIRYPDDPYDRVWESDLNRRPNFLVGEAAGTQRISTNRSIRTGTREFPPEKVMQTAVVGTEGNLTYRLNLEGFPANARAFAYLAEIEDLGPNVTRKFRMSEPYVPGFSTAVVNIEENAGGSYSLYEPNSMNMTLEFVLSFAFSKTEDSTVGPLVNALEISRYVRISSKTNSNDVAVLDALRNMATPGAWVYDYGDPCNPIPWDWINCSNTSPPRITKIILSRKNLTGDIPPGIGLMEGLTELRLDSNSLTGSIPDMSNLRSLTVVHLENNQLTGQLPSYFGDLPNLQELYIQNNSLSGEIPSSLLNGNLVFQYDGNPWISQKRNNWRLIVGISVGAFLVFLLLVGSLLYFRYFHKKPASGSVQGKRRGDSSRFTSKRSNAHSAVKGASLFIDEAPDVAYFTVAEVEKMTQNYAKKIGRGSFGPVYHGKMKDGREVAIKHMADSSYHGAHQFENEVALLSRIHHRNLVPLIGYSDEGPQRNLVYEYMHNGSLRDHLHDPLKLKGLDWLTRLCIAEDAAKGLEYLHNGCNPSIIHRDVKTSNILLDINMRAKVSDFGLSRQTDESLTHISSVARGTVGYVDPEYYACQQLTEKSDVYSFGVVLLELISGRKPVSADEYGAEWNIVHWARSYIRKGDVNAIIHPSLQGKVEIESVWRVAEIAILSVEPHGASRPTMKEVVLAIQEAAAIEGRSRETSASDFSSLQPAQLQIHSNPLDLNVSAFDADSVLPSAR